MKRAFLALLFVAAPVWAQDGTPAAAPVTAVAPVPSPSTPSFLAMRGVISSDELVDVLGVTLSGEQRAKVDEALAKRNAALARANDELSATLRDVLRETDEGLVRRADESAEAKRMERLRRLQPSRYRELMNRKKKEEKQK